MAHLKKGMDGHLLKNADGHLVKNCGGATYVQARRCSVVANTDVGPLEDVWIATADVTLPFYFQLDDCCRRYYIDDTCPQSDEPGTVYLLVDITELDDCETGCDCQYCPDETPDQFLVEFTGVDTSGDIGSEPTLTYTGTLGTYHLHKVKDETGSPCFWQAYTRDITEHAVLASGEVPGGADYGVVIVLTRTSGNWSLVAQSLYGAIFSDGTAAVNCNAGASFSNSLLLGGSATIAPVARSSDVAPDSCHGTTIYSGGESSGNFYGCPEVICIATTHPGGSGSAFDGGYFSFYRFGCGWRSSDEQSTIVWSDTGKCWVLTIDTITDGGGINDGIAIWKARDSACPPLHGCEWVFIGFLTAGEGEPAISTTDTFDTNELAATWLAPCIPCAYNCDESCDTITVTFGSNDNFAGTYTLTAHDDPMTVPGCYYDNIGSEDAVIVTIQCNFAEGWILSASNDFGELVAHLLVDPATKLPTADIDEEDIALWWFPADPFTDPAPSIDGIGFDGCPP